MLQKIIKAVLITVVVTISAASGLAQYSQPIRDVDNSARQPMKYSVNYTTGPDSTSSHRVASVPLGKRLVVEHIQASCDKNIGYLILTETGPKVPLNATTFIPPSTQAGTIFFTDHSLRQYCDPGVDLYVDTAPGTYFCSIIVTGYYVTLP